MSQSSSTPEQIRQIILDIDRSGVWPTVEKARAKGMHCASHIFRRARWELKMNGQLGTRAANDPVEPKCPRKPDPVEPKAPWLPAWARLWPEALLAAAALEIESVRMYRAAWKHLRRASG